jgi:putative ABC transport system permease protein
MKSVGQTTSDARPQAVRGTQSIALWEIVMLAIDSFRLNQIRFALTALGMVIGTASLILVVTIGLSGRRYVLTSIQNIGTNLIWAEYAGLSDASIASLRDYLTVDDMRAIEQQVPGIQAASPVLNLHQSFPSGAGKERDVLILGVSPEYADIRRLYLVAGRFFDQQDSLAHSKAALVTEKFALTQFGSADEAIGKTLAISNVPFVIIGVFRESFDTFGQSEIVDETVLIPYTVARYFTGTDAVNQIYFSMTDSGSVPWATTAILKAIKARHRSESVYDVGNLSEVLSMAGKTATAFSIVLLLFSMVTLMVSGVGIMNIMLATVRSRIREIGIRKALGATFREIQLQFLAEAVLISLSGGIVGTVVAMALPFSIAFFTGYRLQVSWLSAVIAVLVSCAVGIAFGTFPAVRAARMDPVEALKYE